MGRYRSPGQHLLDMTEHTLTGAKQSERQRQVRKQYSFKIFSIVGLIAGCLLMVVWFVYLYRASFKETAYQVNDCFEAAFYDEVLKRRLCSTNRLIGMERMNGKSVESPFAKEQREFLEKEQSKYKVNRFGVVHMYNPVDLNYRLRSALIMQRSINESGMELPLRAVPRFCFCFQVGSLGNDL